ncbi:hypothetical protein DNTS_029935 [Danionella cerebrum]|uniref:Ig-like domain-containing protein n=1 Tax=Danionella cerebrum TaxID=2873325 RepID=A0A553RPZ8_9TELE|nr:hypothetical protein DNTS_029935 [Danionella translucida]
MSKLIALILTAAAAAVVVGDWIGPNESVLTRRENDRVMLSCTYETNYQYIDLYWYRQYPNSEPQFLLWKGAQSNDRSHIPDARFDSSTSTTSTELIIKAADPSDSALYYCAMENTMIQKF